MNILDKITRIYDDHAKMVQNANDIYRDAVCSIEDEVKFCAPHCPITTGIHVFSGIEKLAEIAGAEILTRERNCEYYPVEKYFVYRGREFFQLEGGAE